MIPIALLAAAAAVLIALAFVPLLGLRRIVFLGLLASLALAPYPFMRLEDDALHFGIIDSQFVAYTYSLAILVTVLFVLRSRGVAVWLTFAVLTGLYFLLCVVAVWGATDAQWAGTVHYLTGLAGFAAGIGIGLVLLNDRLLSALWAWAIVGIMIVQLLLMGAQLLGYPVGLYGTVEYFVAESRPVGSFIHPSVAGKVTLLLLLTLFPLTRVDRRSTRVAAWVGIGAAVVVTTAPQGRANIAAIVSAALLWVLLDRRLSLRRRLTIGALLGVAALPLVAIVLPRILADPDGGDRQQLLATGIEQILRAPWFGIGPNSYSSVVGQRDLLAAEGFPVHVTFLHQVAELGIIGAVLVALPLCTVVVVAVFRARAAGGRGDAAIAVLCCLPGIVLIAITGWGLLLQGTLPLMYVCFGIALGMMYRDETDGTVIPPTRRAEEVGADGANHTVVERR